ncbi:hypothetical protein QPK31_13355 [Massilia sp. YIM B02769]|uniref:hypothetical protein n=1 Tax=Massilia sp. YIM B02769 TaxID=3050129 RepID=UPI0025B63779|nr:hypothetical protein [Massilia sp. YIM B02769]MDN4059208.1 hypothetical protein [Massilia sp. YIM B02769]
MREDTPGRRSPGTRRLFGLDLAAHGTALLSCMTGGVVLESVVLMGAASHHAASLGFRLLFDNKDAGQSRIRSGDALCSLVQLFVWACCLPLAICVTAMGAHGMFHAEPLNALAIAGFAIPGALAATTTAALALRPGGPGRRGRAVDAMLSGAPAVLAFCVAFSPLGVEAGKLDALAGLSIVLMLCARTVLHLGRILD